MRTYRERIDSEPPAEREPVHQSPGYGLTPGQLAAQLGVSPSRVERLLHDAGFRSRRGNSAQTALSKTVPPELARTIAAKVGGVSR